MQVQIPARLFALPTRREFDTDFAGNKLASPRVAHVVHAIIDGEPVKLFSDEDPTAGLNGSRSKLENGAMIDVVATLRLYAKKAGGLGVQLEGFAEPGKA